MAEHDDDLMDGEPPRETEPFRLDGRVALVTGGARGIGFATARRLAEAGADVAVNDVDADALDEAVTRLRSTGRRILALPADVADLAAATTTDDPPPAEGIRDVHRVLAEQGRLRMDIVGSLGAARASYDDGAQLVVYNLTATVMTHLAELRTAVGTEPS